MLEASAANLPIITTNVGGIPEVIRNGETGVLIEPEDETALTQAITGLIENPEKRTWFGRNARALVEREYRIDTMIEKTLRVYS